MVPDLVAGVSNFTRDLRKASYVCAALEECRFRMVAIEEIQQVWAGLAGAVVEGQCDGSAGAHSFVDGWGEQAGRSASDGVVHDACAGYGGAEN